MRQTLPLLEAGRFPPVRRGRLETLQINLGYRCNQSCVHCHVNAGPTRTEQMDDATIESVLAFLSAANIPLLDITGGAPELHPRFRDLVISARQLGTRVIDRCNLTVLEEPGNADLPDFGREAGRDRRLSPLLHARTGRPPARQGCL
jgi:radical SAM/Cys-rich protein